MIDVFRAKAVVVALLLMVCGAGVLSFSNISSGETLTTNKVASGDSVSYEVHPGDIIIVRDGHLPWYFSIMYWNHALLYIGDNQAISALSEGVKISPVDIILESMENYAIVRVKGTPDVNAVINFTIERVGYPFDWISPFLLTKQIDPPQWHFGFGYYCTELIWAAYLNETGIDLDQSGYGWINIWEMYKSDQVELVYLHDPVVSIPYHS